MRPASSQIDLWPSLGLDLDWDEYISFAKKGEHFQPPGPDLVALGAGYEENAHGFNGLLTTCIAPHMTTGDIHEVFNATFKKLGIPPRHEFNGGDLRGFGVQQVTQDGKVDIREDAARAYYYPFEDRTNLVVMVNTTATRILWSDESSYGGVRASAAEVVNQNGDVSTINATREIILSAGALRSPAILEHSGVGNPSILSKFSIKTKVNLPAVGENFQDQSVIAIIGLPLGENPTGFPAFVAHASLEDLFGSETEAFYNSTLARLPEYAATIAAQNGGASSAEAQEHILKTQLDLLFKSNTPTSELVPAALGPILGGVFWFLQPFSRGNVHINSTERTVQPVIDAKFFQLDIDGQVAVATARFIRKFLTTSPTSDRINVTSITPNFETVPEDASDDVWLDWIKTKSNFSPNFHHLGTCAMLPKKYGGVVDNEFRVYGTKNVRVVDLSVIPLQVAGHSTALLYGVAEWAAEKIKKSS